MGAVIDLFIFYTFFISFVIGGIVQNILYFMDGSLSIAVTFIQVNKWYLSFNCKHIKLF